VKTPGSSTGASDRADDHPSPRNNHKEIVMKSSSNHLRVAGRPGSVSDAPSLPDGFRTYPTETGARRAIRALRATGVAAGDIRLLTGRGLGDARRGHAGGFAGPVAPDAPVGTYGNRPVLRRQGAGGFAGDPDHQRQGSFADTDRVVIVTYHGDAERARVTGLRGARRLLGRASLGRDNVDRAVHELRDGHAVVLVNLREIGAGEDRARLEQHARAA
jgi:hypothetical protein